MIVSMVVFISVREDTFPESKDSLKALSLMDIEAFTPSGWPGNWSECRPYWSLLRGKIVYLNFYAKCKDTETNPDKIT